MGFSSFRFTVNSTIPQGSNLGPLLFLLFTNDINEIFTVDSLLYADDLKLFSRIHNMHDCIELQSHVDLVSDWCSRNKLVLNKDKCISVSYSRKHDICRFDYKIDNHTFSSRSSTKDLGSWFDSRLVFHVHISSVVAASLKLLGFLFRSCNEFRSVKCLTTFNFSLVRSRLEYGSIIWSPYYATYINSIESVQRKFLKYLSFKEDGIYPPIGVDYDFLCSKFNFTPLKVRRVLDTVTFFFKLFHNKVDCSSLLSGPCISVPQILS
jgi:ribonuclease P/MRP protein subunit RPP40